MCLLKSNKCSQKYPTRVAGMQIHRALANYPIATPKKKYFRSSLLQFWFYIATNANITCTLRCFLLSSWWVTRYTLLFIIILQTVLQTHICSLKSDKCSLRDPNPCRFVVCYSIIKSYVHIVTHHEIYIHIIFVGSNKDQISQFQMVAIMADPSVVWRSCTLSATWQK